MDFSKNIAYSSRRTKAKFVYEKYKDILNGNILDVGADEMYLKEYLPSETDYTGIGLGENENLIKIDLEEEPIPFEDNTFDCVLCLDVLEHLDNIHDVFDSICSVSKKWVIVSLPNPWRGFLDIIRFKQYKPGQNTKFYGLPIEKPNDRHKWFYSSSEANNFVSYRSKINGFSIQDHYISNKGSKGNVKNKSLLHIIYNISLPIYNKVFFRNDIHLPDIYESTSWWVLSRDE
jgi:hypothetical protein